MFASIATTALLAAGLASARSVSGGAGATNIGSRKLSQVSASGSASSNGGHKSTRTSSPVKGHTHTTSSSSVTCHGSASSSGFSYAKDAHVAALTDAIVWGCSNKIDYNWAAEIRYRFQHAHGAAVAKVWADAKAECYSSGNAYGCAYAYANAERWAKATVSAYASAWALAINECNCNQKPQDLASYSFGSAYEMEDLVAKVSATAEADVCVYGDDSAYAHVESHCIQAIYADVWAKSVSLALIKGKCYTELEADTFIHAEAVIEQWEYVDCASHASTYY